MGMVLPATAEPEGYSAEKAKGNIKVIPPKAAFYFEMEMGALSPAETKNMEDKIGKIIKGHL